ncbi:hypothetical protein TPY_2355 [Sulfobacillus acidophilus TPY]|uniref:Uncharacterized protein n=1 Tax=Sulfobacillus acidophilus (strain ATCC 700253 / DSM 10332 / NAL) TaxID=679936 RepID=G8U117_SULAD|nr:hypothetical protein TPY_2355 [Sulfobacillus acidophilus TPY]AEW06562.1 hypothetical protein Sulac_3115 [Sulfobacillus acidophilus DSM 10332]
MTLDEMVARVNAAAGMTLAVMMTCERCGQRFPGSPRMRVARCLSCRDAARRLSRD